MVDLSRVRRTGAHCSSCAMRHLCVPEGLCANDVSRLENVITLTRAVKRGDSLFRSGDEFGSLYAVRSGSLKTVIMHDGGREQVTGLLLAGDALGLDGIGEGRHTCDAVALEDSSVCVVPYALFESICRESDTLQRRMLRMMSQAINRESGHVMQLGMLRADERVAQLLLDLSARLARRGYAAAEFTLRMTRDEIGSYLGMTLETVSRTLTRFDKLGSSKRRASPFASEISTVCAASDFRSRLSSAAPAKVVAPTSQTQLFVGDGRGLILSTNLISAAIIQHWIRPPMDAYAATCPQTTVASTQAVLDDEERHLLEP